MIQNFLSHCTNRRRLPLAKKKKICREKCCFVTAICFTTMVLSLFLKSCICHYSVLLKMQPTFVCYVQMFFLKMILSRTIGTVNTVRILKIPPYGPPSRGSLPVFLRKTIATCDFPGGCGPHVPSSQGPPMVNPCVSRLHDPKPSTF